MVDGMHTFWLMKDYSTELYSKCRISRIVGNVRIHENSLIIQKYFRTPLKRSKKFSYPLKMLQNILVPPLFHSAPVPGIKNDRSLSIIVSKQCRKRCLNSSILTIAFQHCTDSARIQSSFAVVDSCLSSWLPHSYTMTLML